MKKFFRSNITIFCGCVLVVAAVALTGCGKDDEQVTDTSSAPQVSFATDPGAGPGAAPANPALSGAPGALPTGAPASPGALPPASTGNQTAGGFPQVAFSAVKKNSAVETVTDRQNGTVVKFLRFKYSDWNGNINVCELPEIESKAIRTTGNWIVTFDVYKIKSTGDKISKKKVRSRLADFPFISPKAADGSDQQGIPQGLPSGGGYGGFGGSSSSGSGGASGGGLRLPGT